MVGAGMTVAGSAARTDICHQAPTTATTASAPAAPRSQAGKRRADDADGWAIGMVEPLGPRGDSRARPDRRMYRIHAPPGHRISHICVKADAFDRAAGEK